MNNNEIIEILKHQQKALSLLHETVQEICNDELSNCKYKNQYDIWLEDAKKNLKKAKNIIASSTKKPVIDRSILVYHLEHALRSIHEAWCFQSKPITFDDIHINLKKVVKDYPEIMGTLVELTIKNPFYWFDILIELEPKFAEIDIPESKAGDYYFVSNAVKYKWKELQDNKGD